MATVETALGLNAEAARLVEALVADAGQLRIAVRQGSSGERLIDAGLRVPGSLEAGLRVAAITMGGLGTAALAADGASPLGWHVAVRSSQPVLACLGSQYAGWKLEGGPADPAFEGLGSGPARALARREPIYAEQGWVEQADSAVLAVESPREPPDSVLADVAQACSVGPAQLTVILVPTSSLAGSVQVAARGLESAVAKARHLGFPLDRILDGLGTVPLAAPHPDSTIAMGRTNDAMIYGGRVALLVSGPSTEARDLAASLPSRTSRHYGQPFARTLAEAGGDFYAIDADLFGPALVSVTAVEHGQTWKAGGLDPAMVEQSFGACQAVL